MATKDTDLVQTALEEFMASHFVLRLNPVFFLDDAKFMASHFVLEPDETALGHARGYGYSRRSI